MPLGFAGPLLVQGEHAKGEFYVPLACSEGTLVASYNRGMKVLHRSGGVKCAVVGDNMQRAPVFVLEDAASARRFSEWIEESKREIRVVAEATDPFVKLDYIDPGTGPSSPSTTLSASSGWSACSSSRTSSRKSAVSVRSMRRLR